MKILQQVCMQQSNNNPGGNSYENNAEYYEEKAIGRICAKIESIGAKYGRKISSKDQELARQAILDMRRGAQEVSEVLKYYIKAFQNNMNGIGRHIFPSAIPAELSEDGLLTPHQITNMVFYYKKILGMDGSIPGVKACTELMWCDVLVKTNIEALAWLLVSNRGKYLQNSEKEMTKSENNVFHMYMYQHIYAKLHVLKTNIEADASLIPTLYVEPNIRKFSEIGQNMQLALEDMAIVTHNYQKGILGVINITDQLSKRELFEEFIEVAAAKTNPEDQEIFILHLATEREEQVVNETFQRIAVTLHGFEWAHEENPDPVLLTMNYFEHFLTQKGYLPSNISAYAIDKKMLDHNNNAVVTLDPTSGMYVDIVNQKTGEYTNIVEVDL